MIINGREIPAPIISLELRRSLKLWLDFAEGKPVQHRMFSPRLGPGSGLCEWARYATPGFNPASYYELTDIFRDQFGREFGVSPNYPFNGNSQNFHHEFDRRLNPRRLDWVRQILAEQPPLPANYMEYRP